MRRAARCALWTLLLLSGMGGVGRSAAQEAREPHGGCFPPRALPECRSYFVFEVQGVFPLAATRRVVQYPGGPSRIDRDFETRLEWNLGYMVNVGPDAAVGGVVTLGTGGHDPLTGLRLRGRWWTSDAVALELEGGLLRSAANGHRPFGTSGVTADGRLVLHDQGSLFLRWDRLYLEEDEHGDSGGTSDALLLGVGLNNRPAVYGTLAAGVVWAVLLGVFVANSQ